MPYHFMCVLFVVFRIECVSLCVCVCEPTIDISSHRNVFPTNGPNGLVHRAHCAQTHKRVQESYQINQFDFIFQSSECTLWNINTLSRADNEISLDSILMLTAFVVDNLRSKIQCYLN